MNSCLVDVSAAELAQTAVAWDTEKHLRFDVPFQDIKPVIYLGTYDYFRGFLTNQNNLSCIN